MTTKCKRVAHHLQVLGAGDRGDDSGSRSDVDEDGLLDDGDAEVGAFTNNLLLKTAPTFIENNCASAGLN